MRQVIIKFFAILFVLLSVTSIGIGITGCLPNPSNYLEIGSTLGTLAGAILVYSTLEMQRKSLNEEKHRNEIERFDSRFYPILSSFRTDASNMEIKGESLSPKDIGATQSYSCKGETAFAAAQRIVMGLYRYLCDKSLKMFDKEEFDADVRNYFEMSDASCEDFFCPDDDIIEKESNEFVKSSQVPYLADKWGITKDVKEGFLRMDCKERESFLLKTLLDHQSATLSKYIQSLRFILQIIGAVKSEKEKAYYIQHVSCRIGKEELEFLKCFSEFNVITDISYGQR